jgi:C4-dicarboxylate-specific signal transduction histidine kinase
VDEALRQAPLRANIHLHRAFPDGLPMALADPDQVRIAFAQLIRRAQDNMPNGGQLTTRGRPTAGGVAVEWQDTGPHVSPELLRQLAAPLSWENVRALGMGLAMIRAILDTNLGSLIAANTREGGCTITVQLVQAPSEVPPASETCHSLPVAY